jgi:hypothetical protein
VSEKTTVLEFDPRVAGGLMEWDHVPYAEMVRRTRSYYEDQRAAAGRALLALDAGDFSVYHQRGVHVVTNRKLVQSLGVQP